MFCYRGSNIPTQITLLIIIINVNGQQFIQASEKLDQPYLNSTTRQEDIGARTMPKLFFTSTAKERAPITLNDTEFILFSGSNKSGKRVIPGDSESLQEAMFDSTKNIVIVTHGFQASRHIGGQLELKEAFMKNIDVNYFVVDWSACADRSMIFYPVTIDCALVVGKFIADFIVFLENNGADVKKIHLIGHSLGSHAMSQVSNYGLRVSRITGLDPTQVLFWRRPESERLDPSDADFVDVIHTNVGLQGWNKILGQADFFPNGGDSQPSCGFIDFSGCNHEIAYHYFAESIFNNSKYRGIRCLTMEEANDGDCAGESTYMGIASVNGSNGIFYVDVKEKFIDRAEENSREE